MSKRKRQPSSRLDHHVSIQASTQDVGKLQVSYGPGVPRSMVFFVLFYLYMARAVDVRLLYNGGGLIDNFPSFYWGWDFLRDFLIYPGGIVTYLSALLAQSFYDTWLGAAVVTAQAWAICWCTDRTLKALSPGPWRCIRFCGPLLLLAVYAQYGFHFPTTFGLLTALGVFCLYQRLPSRGTLSSSLMFLSVSIVLYIVVGGGYLLFALLCVLDELLSRRRNVLSLIQLAVGVTLPTLVGVLLYRVRVHDAYLELLPVAWKLRSRGAGRTMLEAIYALYLFLPLTVVILSIGQRLRANPSKQSRRRPRPGKQTESSLAQGILKAGTKLIPRERRPGALGFNLATLGLVCATTLVVLLPRDASRRTSLQVDYYARQRQWERVLEIGRTSPYHYLTCHAVNLALFHTKQLGDSMFSYAQHPTALFLTRPGTDPVWQKVDTCLDLGLVNRSENAAALCIETYGERPLLLQRLADINLIKGNLSTAQVYLRALQRVPFWRSSARRRLGQLQQDPNCLEDLNIQQWRSTLLKTDFVGDADTLTLLLTENPGNRMAYEYGMASLLLSKNLDNFLTMLKRYHPPGEKLPRHYQEALLLLRTLRRQTLDIPGYAVSQEIKAQLQAFMQAFRTVPKGKSLTRTGHRKDLEDKYGHTFFYYYFFAD